MRCMALVPMQDTTHLKALGECTVALLAGSRTCYPRRACKSCRRWAATQRAAASMQQEWPAAPAAGGVNSSEHLQHPGHMSSWQCLAECMLATGTGQTWPFFCFAMCTKWHALGVSCALCVCRDLTRISGLSASGCSTCQRKCRPAHALSLTTSNWRVTNVSQQTATAHTYCSRGAPARTGTGQMLARAFCNLQGQSRCSHVAFAGTG